MDNSLDVICSINEAGLPQGLSKLPGQVNPAAWTRPSGWKY
jgi:hypothetical protein